MPSDIPLVHVHPRRSVLITAIVSLAAALVPVTAVVVLLATMSGRWLPAAIAELVAVVVCVLLGLRQLSLFTRVTATALEGNGFTTRTERVPLDRIRSVHMIETYVGQSADTVTQLLVLGDDGRRLFRLRGNYWPDGSLEQVAAALPVPARRAEEPMSLSGFFSAFPTSEYWFENKPWLRVLAIAAGSAAGIAAALWVMTVISHTAA